MPAAKRTRRAACIPVRSTSTTGQRFSLRHVKSGTDYTLETRAFDDGIAYRFIVPGDESKSRVPDERSVFTLPAGSTLWYHGMRGHYEGDYVRRDVGEVPAGEWAAPPLTVKLPNDAGYASISESNLVNYSGFALESDGKRGFTIGLAHRQPVSYPYELRYSKEDVARLSQPAKISGTITTPWRVVIVAPDLNKLVNSDMISQPGAAAGRETVPEGRRDAVGEAGPGGVAVSRQSAEPGPGRSVADASTPPQRPRRPSTASAARQPQPRRPRVVAARRPRR